MKNKMLAASAGLVLMCAAPAFATSNLVNCEGYLIGLSDDVLIEGQARAGSVAAFEQRVCESSATQAGDISDITVYPVFIEELDMATRVIVFPKSLDDD
jgi:hypothetical protein